MKKFIIFVGIVVLTLFLWDLSYYRLGIFVDLHPDAPVTTFMKTDGKKICMERNGEYEPFEIRGVDLGVGVPGEWATDFAVDEDTYLRWFAQIRNMGANTIRVYTILHDDFYNALYKYNKNNPYPLYLIQGVWVSDYALFSHMDAYDDEFMTPFINDCRTMVDVIHGKRSLSLSYGNKGNGSYRKDVTPWVIGYILGVEWESYTVTYTDQKNEGMPPYEGKYLHASEDATPFESFLAMVGDKLVEYESTRYKQQRLVAFANWPTTDPFVYPPTIALARYKVTAVDTEHIKPNAENFISGMFASYHIYPYFPDYLEVMRDTGQYSDEQLAQRIGISRWENVKYRVSQMKGHKIEDYLSDENYIDSYGRYNTYLAYLKAIADYHTMPVVISEYGVTTGRGIAQWDENTHRNQGHMTETEQGQALIDCYKDIMAAGCAGSCIFSWQDEWFKRTWNTLHAVDLDKTPYWSDYQTNEQHFGILTFDPGKEESVCYVDGDISEWDEDDVVISDGDTELSMKYDEKFLYFLAKKENFSPDNDTLYIPIDTTPKSGGMSCDEYGVSFERPADFLMVIHGKNDSRVVVQERYEVLNAVYGKTYYKTVPYEYPPASDSTRFVNIYLALTLQGYLPDIHNPNPTGKKFETGALRYGNANPEAEDFDSLADYIFSGDYVEIRLPWQLLNFSNPSEMQIHGDYYENYGVENLGIDEMYVGLSADKDKTISMGKENLNSWFKTVETHERLKKSYYMIKDYWAAN